jgi:exo-1,4-beta-D-glucosaminidase
MKKNLFYALLALVTYNGYSQMMGNGNMILHKGWQMQSVLQVKENGSEISKPGYMHKAWLPVTLPTTIIAGLLANKQYDFDPFYGNNLQKISGPQFDTSWWFRTNFSIGQSDKNKRVILILHGINYRANIWLNGELVADNNHVVGPFRIFDFDITNRVHFTGENALAIEITRPFNPNKRGGDLAIDYADWIHYPADYNGGIVNNVEISTCDPVAIRHPLVSTKFDLPSLQTAHLEVEAELYNYADKSEEVTVKGKINNNISFQQKLTLQPGEKRACVFTSKDYPQLNIKNPRIWWPWQYGKPLLNNLELTVTRNGKTSSSLSDRFGIRETGSELIDTTARKFLINGKPILLRGAAWAPDIFQRRSPKRQEQEIKLVRDMNMNIVRSEGKLEDDHFYALCDQYGMLVMTGWMCCGSWQYPEKWDSLKRVVAMESTKSVMYWLRNKASVIVWLNGSDMPPRDTTVESDFLSIEGNLHWPNPILATADASKSKVSGFSGVKMNGPYDWVPPIYWETDSNKHGGAWSFATEISPGPSIPPYESLMKFLPPDSMSTNNSLWAYHSGTMEFSNTKIFNEALEGRYGPSSSMKEFTKKAQAQNYEGHRAMMEAFGQYKYHKATGVVQWMLNNPWPSLIWHTYDYYLYPGGTYFGMKKSMEPLHVQFSYKSREIVVVNSTLNQYSGLQIKADNYRGNGDLLYTHTTTVNIGPDTTIKSFAIPNSTSPDPLEFIRLEMKDNLGKSVSINWYWLSGTKDSLNWAKSKWFYTPQSAYAGFQGLENLPLTALTIRTLFSKSEGSNDGAITIRNNGKAIAFFVHLRVLNKKGGTDILPATFDDNYICLAPGESRTIHVLIEGWNLDSASSKADANSELKKE